MLQNRNTRKGNSVLEFTLVGIPLLFVFISIFEMARGMWNYHSLAYAVKEGTRYAVVHGKNCSSGSNSCGVLVSDVARQIANAGIGLDASVLNVTLSSATANVPCNPLNSCLSNSTAWPPAGDSLPGMDLRINGRYLFQSALSMYWPGAGGVNFGTVTFAASSQQRIQF